MYYLMSKLTTQLTALRNDERGATAVEYGLMVALIAAVIVTVVALLGTTISTQFQHVVTAITPK
jgi:pilus assembly protein Flp/PilA